MVTLKKEHITQTFQNIHNLVGNPIYVSVSVLTDSGKNERLCICVYVLSWCLVICE